MDQPRIYGTCSKGFDDRLEDDLFVNWLNNMAVRPMQITFCEDEKGQEVHWIAAERKLTEDEALVWVRGGGGSNLTTRYFMNADTSSTDFGWTYIHRPHFMARPGEIEVLNEGVGEKSIRPHSELLEITKREYDVLMDYISLGGDHVGELQAMIFTGATNREDLNNPEIRVDTPAGLIQVSADNDEEMPGITVKLGAEIVTLIHFDNPDEKMPRLRAAIFAQPDTSEALTVDMGTSEVEIPYYWKGKVGRRGC